eukprot:TRINITY_DN6166_c0_g2_i1.p1 TRINITY_DN6166_c0_g2~~TRINITY_DN6166_c0_g2_i1.p1  ORF type:complete len:716 (+),score=69.29 TRINITY_DN6166_c0_g2_i1:41-2188(+)
MGLSEEVYQENIIKGLKDLNKTVKVSVERGGGWEDKGKGILEAIEEEGKGCRLEIRDADEILLEEILSDDRYTVGQPFLEWEVPSHGLAIRVSFIDIEYWGIVSGYLKWFFSNDDDADSWQLPSHKLDTFSAASTLSGFKRILCNQFPTPLESYAHGTSLLSNDSTHLKKLLQLSPHLGGEIYCGLITLGFAPVYNMILQNDDSSEIFLTTLLSRSAEKEAKLRIINNALSQVCERYARRLDGEILKYVKAAARTRFLISEVIPASNPKIQSLLRGYESTLSLMILRKIPLADLMWISRDVLRCVSNMQNTVEKQTEILHAFLQRTGLDFADDTDVLYYSVSRYGEARREEPLTPTRMLIMESGDDGVRFMERLFENNEHDVVKHLLGLHDDEGTTDERVRHSHTNVVRENFVSFFYSSTKLPEMLLRYSVGCFNVAVSCLSQHCEEYAVPFSSLILRGVSDGTTHFNLADAVVQSDLNGDKILLCHVVKLLASLAKTFPSGMGPWIGLNPDVVGVLLRHAGSGNGGIVSHIACNFVKIVAEGDFKYIELRNAICCSEKFSQNSSVFEGLVARWREDLKHRWESATLSFDTHVFPAMGSCQRAASASAANTSPALFLSPIALVSPASSLSSRLTVDGGTPVPVSPTSSSSSLTFEEEDPSEGCSMWAAGEFTQERDILEQVAALQSLASKERRALTQDMRKSVHRKALVPIHNIV